MIPVPGATRNQRGVRWWLVAAATVFLGLSLLAVIALIILGDSGWAVVVLLVLGWGILSFMVSLMMFKK